MAKNKKKIVYAKKSVLDPDEFDPKNARVLISLRLDGDLLLAIKERARRAGEPYQPMINQMLRELILKAPGAEPEFSEGERRALREMLRSMGQGLVGNPFEELVATMPTEEEESLDHAPARPARTG